jgi:hypothetical protein
VGERDELAEELVKNDKEILAWENSSAVRNGPRIPRLEGFVRLYRVKKRILEQMRYKGYSYGHEPGRSSWTKQAIAGAIEDSERRISEYTRAIAEDRKARGRP